jgi:hypothetical protein
MQHTLTIEITDEQIDRAIIQAIGGATVNVQSGLDDGEDEDEGEDDEPRERPTHLAALVKKALGEAIAKEVSKVTKEVVAESVAEHVRTALHAGFPTFDEWGNPKGRKTLADMIGERVFKPDRNRSDPLEYQVREETAKHIKVMVAEAVKKTSVDIDKLFSEAATEGIATVLKRKLGIS